MFENISKFFKKLFKAEQEENISKDTAKERLHLVLMQDRANVSADFLELMKQEIIEVIKKYIVVDEAAIDVRLTNQANTDGTTGAPALYANIPILNIKNEAKAEKAKEAKSEEKNENTSDEKIEAKEDKQKEKKSSSKNSATNSDKSKKANTEKNTDKEENSIKTENSDNKE